uniref:Putative secreted protein n=1 Tax=Ixodes ricinus TaxID=34613 RepID=A0A6B0UCH6_IXORI
MKCFCLLSLFHVCLFIYYLPNIRTKIVSQVGKSVLNGRTLFTWFSYLSFLKKIIYSKEHKLLRCASKSVKDKKRQVGVRAGIAPNQLPRRYT